MRFARSSSHSSYFAQQLELRVRVPSRSQLAPCARMGAQAPFSRRTNPGPHHFFPFERPAAPARKNPEWLAHPPAVQVPSASSSSMPVKGSGTLSLSERRGVSSAMWYGAALYSSIISSSEARAKPGSAAAGARGCEVYVGGPRRAAAGSVSHVVYGRRCGLGFRGHTVAVNFDLFQSC